MAAMNLDQISCPMPDQDHSMVTLAHGGGGRMMHDLIERLVVPAFHNQALETRHDSAVVEIGGARIAITTDSYVVSPYVFPGGDIGKLAVNGTVNDLAMSGAKPLYLSAALILEEGFPMGDLRRVLSSLGDAARGAGVEIVTGDTKVVDRGKCDSIYINTAGVGLIEHRMSICPAGARPGDAVIVSGDIGRHGIAIMAVREGLSFETVIQSDTAPVWCAVEALLKGGVEVHCLRDLTRGGLASALVEIAEAGQVGIEIDESCIPVRGDVRNACELLGFDPLHVANEGRFTALVPQRDASRAISILRNCPSGPGACVIGSVASDHAGRVTARTALGTMRIVDMFSGEQLPRIC